MRGTGQQDGRQDEDEARDSGGALRRLFATLGPPMPDDPGVGYDPDTAEGQAALRAYLAQRDELYRQADEAWAREHPGAEFRRLTDRIKRTEPTPGDEMTSRNGPSDHAPAVSLTREDAAALLEFMRDKAPEFYFSPYSTELRAALDKLRALAAEEAGQ